MNIPDTPEFSVYQFFIDGSYEMLCHFVLPEPASKIFASATTSLGAQLGTTQRVIITDGGDCIVFEWIYGKGITFPPQGPDTVQ